MWLLEQYWLRMLGSPSHWRHFTGNYYIMVKEWVQLKVMQSNTVAKNPLLKMGQVIYKNPNSTHMSCWCLTNVCKFHGQDMTWTAFANWQGVSKTSAFGRKYPLIDDESKLQPPMTPMSLQMTSANCNLYSTVRVFQTANV